MKVSRTCLTSICLLAATSSAPCNAFVVPNQGATTTTTTCLQAVPSPPESAYTELLAKLESAGVAMKDAVQSRLDLLINSSSKSSSSIFGGKTFAASSSSPPTTASSSSPLSAADEKLETAVAAVKQAVERLEANPDVVQQESMAPGLKAAMAELDKALVDLDAATKADEAGSKGAEKLLATGEEELEKAIGDVEKAEREIAQSTTDTVEKAKDQVTQVAEADKPVEKAVDDVIGNVATDADEPVEKAVDALGQAAEKAADTVSKAVEKPVEKAADVVSKAASDTPSEKAADAVAQAASTDKTVEKIADVVAQATADKPAEKAGDVIAKAVEAAPSANVDATPAAVDKVAEVFSNTNNILDGSANDASIASEQTISNLADNLASATTTAGDVQVDVFFADAVANVVDKAGTFLEAGAAVVDSVSVSL